MEITSSDITDISDVEDASSACVHSVQKFNSPRKFGG